MDRITCRECYFWNPRQAKDTGAECRKYAKGKDGWGRTRDDDWCGEAKALEGERAYHPEKPRFSSQPIGMR